MVKDILEIVFRTASDSFLQVTVFVGVVLVFFGYINFKKRGGLIKAIKKNKKWQPIIGALLGITPGCGGAILIMPLFVRGSVSFGTVVATLIATSGDSAFVLISGAPITYLWLSGLSFVLAVIAGYIVDCCGMKKRFMSWARGGTIKREEEVKEVLHCKAKGHQKSSGLGYKITHSGYWIYWIVLFVGLIIGIAALAGMDIGATWMMILGAVGTLLSFIIMIAGKKYVSDDTFEEEEMKASSLKETMIHDSQETAFVGFWVFVAYLIYELIVYWLGGGDSLAGEIVMEDFVKNAGSYPILAAALLGMIPGCGVQIIFVSLYLKGAVPVFALIAHTVSQDGDALFPLLVLNKRSAFWATVVTTIFAIIFGYIFFFILG